MKTFIDFLNERQLVLNKKAYPKFNNILIMAGGGGSGKGFVLSNVLSFEGKKFDVDELKKQVINIGKLKADSAWNKAYLAKYGKSLSDIDLKNPVDVSNIHAFVEELGIEHKLKTSFFTTAANTEHKPNVIFDVTLKNMKKLDEIAKYAEMGGYKKENMHVVWVVNEWATVLEQNAKRARSVDPGILKGTFIGAVDTVLKMVKTNCSKINGDVWVVFNKKRVDNLANLVNTSKYTKNDVFELKKYTAYQFKKAGQPFGSIKDFENSELYQKLLDYIPK